MITIVIVALIIVIAAWRWEMNEMHRLEDKQDLNSVPEDQRIDFLQELSCFAWTEAVAWRRIVIATIISTFLIFMFYRKKMDMSMVNIITIAVIIAASFMVIDMFRSFHWDRQVCMKASPDAPWFKKAVAEA